MEPEQRAAFRSGLRKDAASVARQRLVASPNAPRPTGVILELAEMLRRIEANYEREGSGPGTRFEGRLLEDVQALAIVRRLRELELLDPEPLG